MFGESGTTVASEPLCDASKDAHAWTTLAPGSVLTLGADGAQQLVHAELRAAAAATA